MAFTQIQNELFKLGYEEAVMITVIKSWSENKKNPGQHYMSQEEYCDTYNLKSRRYFTILKKLKDYGIVEVVKRLTNNRQVLKVNQNELAFVLEKGYYALEAQSPCTPCTTTLHDMHSDSAPDAPLECTPCTTHILDKELDKVTIEDTKISTRPESFSFDIFKEEIKPNDIDTELALFAKDFDKNY